MTGSASQAGIRRSILWIGLSAVAVLWVGAATMSGQADDHPTLPAGPGRDVMIRVCSKCHAPEYAASQQLDAAGWRELVDQMASKGAEASEAEFEAIVRYLTSAFPAGK